MVCVVVYTYKDTKVERKKMKKEPKTRCAAEKLVHATPQMLRTRKG